MNTTQSSPASTPSLRLLIIDDDAVDRLVIRRLLAAAGLAVTICERSDAEQGGDEMELGTYDAVLLDYHLPGQNGLAVLHRGQARATPIIVLSGQTDHHIVAELMKHGAADYLVKDGLTSERLVTTLLNATAAARDRQLAAERAAALRLLVEATAPVVGADFFSVLVRHLAAALGAHQVMVAELVDEGHTFHTLARWADGTLQPGREYALANSPCREVIAEHHPCARSDVRLEFAGRQGHLSAAAYLGVALRDADRPLGTLSLWGDRPFAEVSGPGSLEAILAIFAERAAAELLRLRAQTALASSLRLEKGLAGCARALLADLQPPRTLDLALRHLLETTSATAISLFENEDDEEAGHCVRLTAEAHLPSHAGEAPRDPRAPERIPYRSGLRRWENDLSSGMAVGGLVRLLPADEQPMLSSAGVRSVLALPVHVAGMWAGFLRIDDCRADYRWLKEEIRLLRSGADLVGAYLERRGPRVGSDQHLFGPAASRWDA